MSNFAKNILVWRKFSERLGKVVEVVLDEFMIISTLTTNLPKDYHLSCEDGLAL